MLMPHSRKQIGLPQRGLFLLMIVLLMIGALSVLPALGQDATPSAYTFSGSVGFGYRLTDVNGSRAKYDQLLNLQEGFRLFDTQLNFLPKEPGTGWFDRLTLSGQGLGGDPFPVVNLQVRKYGLYDFRANYRGTQYFVNLPQTNFSPNLGWIDRRRFSDLELRYTPTKDLRLRVFYNRSQRDGSALATSPFFYIPTGPDIWFAFGRANALPWEVPLKSKSDVFGIGADYRLKNTNLHIDQSFRRADDPQSLGGLDGKALELLGPLSPAGLNLVVQNWDSTTHYEGPTTSIHFDSDVWSRLTLRGGYIYNHSSGPGDLDGTIISPLGVSVPPIVLNINGRGDSTITSHTADFGYTLKLPRRIEWLTDYRYQSFRQRGSRVLQATRADLPAPVALGDDSVQQDYGLNSLETQIGYVPVESVRIQAGLLFLKQDVTRTDDGAIIPGTRRTWSYSPVIRASWKPNANFFVRGTFETRTVVDPYTRLGPEDTHGSSIRAQYTFRRFWRIDNVWTFRNLETAGIDYVVHTRSNSTTLSYSPESLVGFYGGFTYDSFYAQNSIVFQGGTPPLTGLFSTDQTIDRTTFGGLKINPVKGLVLDLSGQFIRSTGFGVISSEPSTAGPLTWATSNSVLSYEIRRLGKLSLGWQRSYYLENLLRTTDYGANSITFRIDRSF
jgi:hypothetical protein